MARDAISETYADGTVPTPTVKVEAQAVHVRHLGSTRYQHQGEYALTYAGVRGDDTHQLYITAIIDARSCAVDLQ